MATREIVVYLIALLLMLFRADWWWWGKITPIVLLGWLTVAELYQLAIWLVGWLLVIYTARRIWKAD